MEKVIHEMKLRQAPFERIKSGEKSIELRLYDEKRRGIKRGDTVIFTNISNGERLKTTVVEVYPFDNFERLYESLPLLRCGYTKENISTAKASDMEEYYSKEEQSKYGVVGIELSL